MTFDEFWALYPRHDAKADARKAWMKLNPDDPLGVQIEQALAWQVHREDWIRDDGQYIPLPATWLRGERWEDERRGGNDRRMSKGGILYECPHRPACGTRWDCGRKQQRERMAS